MTAKNERLAQAAAKVFLKVCAIKQNEKSMLAILFQPSTVGYTVTEMTVENINIQAV